MYTQKKFFRNIGNLRVKKENVMKKLLSLGIGLLLSVLVVSSVYAKEYSAAIVIDGKPYVATIIVNDKTGNIQSIVITSTVQTIASDVISSSFEGVVGNNVFTMLFNKPTTNSNMCMTFLEDGEIVEILGKNKSGTWLKLNLFGERCWIKASDMKSFPDNLPVIKE